MCFKENIEKQTSGIADRIYDTRGDNMDLGSTVLEVVKVSFSYNGKSKVLNNVNFVANKGEVLVIAGPNGCGKTTLIKLIFDLLDIQSGNIKINGQHNTNINAKKNVLYLPSDNILPEFLTGTEYINLMCKMYNINLNEELFQKLVKFYIMKDMMNDLIECYSHGMTKKLQLICAFLIQPNIIIIDETLNGIDLEAKEITKVLIKKITEKGCTIIMCSHDLELAEEIGERAILMNKGEVKKQIIIEDLKNKTTLSEIFRKIIGFKEEEYEI